MALSYKQHLQNIHMYVRVKYYNQAGGTLSKNGGFFKIPQNPPGCVPGYISATVCACAYHGHTSTTSS